MWSRVKFLINRLRERLWVRPLTYCILSIAGAFIAKLADHVDHGIDFPKVQPDSIEVLLSITASSMLVIATLAVASMVSAYASAAGSATPRSLSLLLADHTTKNALSTFMGAFIYAIVALVALKNNYYQESGHFLLFGITVFVLGLVVITFVRWVDWIARLGRVGNTMEKVEDAALTSLHRRRRSPALGGVPVTEIDTSGTPVYSERPGYVQHVEVNALQACADQHDITVHVAALPGTFACSTQPLAYLERRRKGSKEDDQKGDEEPVLKSIRNAFRVGNERVYDDDPRFGFIALSEIASRALSPAVNDPGTAIEIIGAFVRLFTAVVEPLEENEEKPPECAHVRVPKLTFIAMTNDAFRPVARDGAAIVEVQIHLQKALASLAALGNESLKSAAERQSRQALKRSRQALTLQDDLDTVTSAAAWSE